MAYSGERLESRVLLDASGIFSTIQSVSIPGGDGRDVLLGDMDNDGHLDAVVIAENGNSRVFRNDGHGNFTVAGTAFGPARPVHPVLADFDGDGRLDVAIADLNGGLRVWSNRGNFQFTASTPELMPTGPQPLGLVAGDVNGDSHPDLVIAEDLASTAGSCRVLLNDGHGQFVDAGIDLANGLPAEVNGGDFDGDGDFDLLVTVGSRHRETTLFRNNGVGQFAGTPLNVLVDTPLVGDLDGDGDLDIYQWNPNSPDQVFLNDGTGSFTDSGQSLSHLTQYGAALGDIDGDGDLDVVTLSADSFGGVASTLWLNDGSGHFTAEAMPFQDGISIALGDIDGDGDLDAIADTGSQLYLSRNRTITDVQLPAGGGNFEILQVASDIDIRQVGGREIFRESAVGIKILRIQGSTGDDRVDASAINGLALVLNGLAGSDTLIGSMNADSLNGGEGNDQLLGLGVGSYHCGILALRL